MGKQEIFISWSGERSRRIAEHLQIWLKRTIQTLKPFISTKDVEKGTFWFTEIKDKLSETNLGIICLTAENKDKPWVLFEAGALSKGLSISRVCTLLIDVEPKDIVDPLARFNHTTLEKDSFLLLLTTINNSLGDDKIDDEVLVDVYNDSWERFYNKCHEIIDNTESINTEPKRTNDDIISDILNISREVDKKIDFLINENDVNQYLFQEKTCELVVSSKTSIGPEIENLVNDFLTTGEHYTFLSYDSNGASNDGRCRYVIKIPIRYSNRNSYKSFIKRMVNLRNKISQASNVLDISFLIE